MCNAAIRRWGAPLLACWLIASLSFGQSGSKSAVDVDGQDLIDKLGDDRVVVEVNLGSWLLRPVIESDPELMAAAGGLESIYALIIDLSDANVARRAEQEVAAIEKRLTAGGWERIVRIKEEGARIKVLVRRVDAERIGGLIVLMLDTDDQDEPVLVFAKIAGVIDLAALQKLSEEMDLPGLSDIEWKE